MTASVSAAKTFRALAHARRSSRRFQPDRRIPSSILKDILESTLKSPSGFNLQPTQVIMVQCPHIKGRLSSESMLGLGNQYRVNDASAVAVFLADLEVHKRIDRIYSLEKGHRDPNYLATMPIASSFLTGEGHAATLLKQLATSLISELQPMPSIEPIQAWSYKNAALMAQSYTLAATSHELATCIMEGFDVRRAKEVLRVPDRYGIPLMVATGYEYENPATFQPTPRLSMEEVVFGDTFGAPLDLSENLPENVPDDDIAASGI